MSSHLILTNKAPNLSDKVDFDEYAENYQKILQEQLRFFDSDEEYFAEYKIKIIIKYIKNSPKKILEYGCGVGRNLKYLTQHFQQSKIYATDISKKSLDIAKFYNQSVKFYFLGEDTIVDKFDLIFVALVFHHIEPGSRFKVIEYITDLLQEGGNIFIFEHNPYNFITRYLVNTCAFDADAVLLTKRKLMQLLIEANLSINTSRYTLFFPSLLKKLRFLEPILGYLPLGGQYFISAKKR
jgi:SAM-dependent methyltransferase